MQHDDNPYAAPAEVDETVPKEYDLYGLALYCNKTAVWGWWTVRLLLLDVFQFLLLFFIAYFFPGGDRLFFILVFPVHIALIVIVFYLIYLSVRLLLHLKLERGFFTLLVLGILTSGYGLILSLPWLRSKAKKILEIREILPKDKFYDLPALKLKMRELSTDT